MRRLGAGSVDREHDIWFWSIFTRELERKVFVSLRCINCLVERILTNTRAVGNGGFAGGINWNDMVSIDYHFCAAFTA